MIENQDLRNVQNQFHEKCLNGAFGEGALKFVEQQLDDSVQSAATSCSQTYASILAFLIDQNGQNRIYRNEFNL